MEPAKEWILFLEKNPQFYEVSKGDFYMRFLEELGQGPKSASDLKSPFPEIKEDNLRVIMDLLLKLRLVSIAGAGQNLSYKLTSDGKKLLSAHRKISSFFNV